MKRAAVCVCVCVRAIASLALPLTRLPPCLPLSVPACPLPIHSVCRCNKLGAEGGTAVAQALRHVPQLQELYLWCALTTARPERDACRGGAARSERKRVRVRAAGCDGHGDCHADADARRRRRGGGSEGGGGAGGCVRVKRAAVRV